MELLIGFRLRVRFFGALLKNYIITSTRWRRVWCCVLKALNLRLNRLFNEIL